MYIRCGSCHGALWVEMAEVAEPAFSATCPTCGKKYSLEGGRDADEAGKHLAEEARQLVRETKLDLPSAYSVLLGVTSLEELLDLADPDAPPRQSAPDPTSHGHGKMAAFDPSYQAAVDAGYLTPLQAMHRGARRNYAALVAKRYRIPEEMSLDVADNKISLLEAIRRRGPDPGPPVQLNVPAPRSRSWLSWTIAGVVAAVVVIMVLGHSTKTVSPTAGGGTSVRTVEGAEVRTDQWGRVLQVSAGDPKSVLTSYCAADQEHRFEAIDIVPMAQEGSEGRLGLLRRAGRAAEILSIEVTEDRAGNRWVAGDGKAPLVPHTAPAAAARAVEQR